MLGGAKRWNNNTPVTPTVAHFNKNLINLILYFFISPTIP